MEKLRRCFLSFDGGWRFPDFGGELQLFFAELFCTEHRQPRHSEIILFIAVLGV